MRDDDPPPSPRLPIRTPRESEFSRRGSAHPRFSATAARTAAVGATYSASMIFPARSRASALCRWAPEASAFPIVTTPCTTAPAGDFDFGDPTRSPIDPISTSHGRPPGAARDLGGLAQRRASSDHGQGGEGRTPMTGLPPVRQALRAGPGDGARSRRGHRTRGPRRLPSRGAKSSPRVP